MKIAIIGGTGKEAQGLVLRLARVGEEVIIGSRQQEKAERAASEFNQHLDHKTVRGLDNRAAAAAADLVILTVPYSAHPAILSDIAEQVRGKILIDATVPVDPQSPRKLARRSELSAAEEAQQLLGEAARVVAAFQNISADAMADLSNLIECDVLVCGDDKEAKAIVIKLIQRLGIRAFDAGPLRMARFVEGLTPLLISLNRRYKSTTAGIRITGLSLNSQ